MAKKDIDQLLILDRFTDSDFRSWNESSQLFTEYEVKLFFHLEALRTIRHQELCDALLGSKTTKIKKENWWRFVDLVYSNEPLSSKGSLVNGKRFNIGNDLNSKGIKSFPALYVAENEKAAYAEKFGRLKTDSFEGHEMATRLHTSYTAVRLKFELNNVFDLSNASKLVKFTQIISKFELTKELKQLANKLGIQPGLITKPALLRETFLADNWRFFPMQYEIPANPQLFGRILRDAGFEGIIYPSTKLTGKKCIAIFPENLSNNDSYIELQDPAPTSVTHTKLSGENWKILSSI